MEAPIKDSILRSLLQKHSQQGAPEELKNRIMNEIRLKPIPRQPATEKKLRVVAWSVGVIFILCLITAILITPGQGWQLPKLGSINLNIGISLRMPVINNFLQNYNLPELTMHKWIYYLGGGLLLFWGFFILNQFLSRIFTRSGQNSE
ncbi:MAG: hypothetical protein J7L96_08825 [Bacteroidales bacterium]|nr:hypothetical protein [Bacteroidales bacterium]